jgi:hypothetical protein
MHATMRRYDGVDESRTDELTKKIDESLLPQLSKLPGFSGYYLIESGTATLSSISFFESLAQGEESTRVAGEWIRHEKLEGALPNPPKVTRGKVIMHKPNGAGAAL